MAGGPWQGAGISQERLSLCEQTLVKVRSRKEKLEGMGDTVALQALNPGFSIIPEGSFESTKL